MQTQPEHPGIILKRRLNDCGITASKLASDIGVPTNRVTGILNGERKITADTALRLGHWFSETAEEWLIHQYSYDLAMSYHEIADKLKSMPRLSDVILQQT